MIRVSRYSCSVFHFKDSQMNVCKYSLSSVNTSIYYWKENIIYKNEILQNAMLHGYEYIWIILNPVSVAFNKASRYFLFVIFTVCDIGVQHDSLQHYRLTHAVGTMCKSLMINKQKQKDGCPHNLSCKKNITKIIIPYGCGKPITKMFLPMSLYKQRMTFGEVICFRLK